MSSSAPNPSASAEREEESFPVEEKGEGGAPSSDPPPAGAPTVPLPPPPEEPALGDCCGSGCVRCVWDIYFDELEAYNRLIAGREAARTEKNPDQN